MAMMCFLPLSAAPTASLPHVFLSSCFPPVPNPILESGDLQSFCSLPRIPIRALEWLSQSPLALNPSLLQLRCNEALEPISDFHVSRPREVFRYFPSAIRENKDLACFVILVKFMCWPIFIPRQILVNDALQYVGSLVSCESNPVTPPLRLKVSLLFQIGEL